MNGVFLFGILFGYVLFPSLFKGMIAKKIGLKPGSEIRELYTKVPFPIDFKMYLFNITNKDEVTNGGKPRVQEIGPYVFEEWKEKFDMSDNDEDDTLTFNMKNTFIFRPDLSKGLTGNEVITTVNSLIMGMALAVNVDKKPMLPLVSDAINGIFHNPKDAFWTGRVMDYLFDGIEIDCSSEEFAAKATCSIFATGEVKAVQPLREDFYKYSLFGAVNGSGIGIYKVFRGIKNYRDVGRVISFNDETEMSVWGGDECNQYKGTDSTIFPPGLKKEQGLWAYEPTICLSIGAHYERDSNYQGIPTIRMGLDFGDARKDEKLQCFCLDPPHDCPRPGTMNLFQCVGAPIVISMPHFYNADPSLLTKIASGLMPNETEHAVFIDFETITGSPVNAAKRLQFNLDVVPIPEVECMKNLPEVVMPLFWVEESAALNKTYVNILKYQLFLVLKIVKIIQWLSIIIGGAGTIFSAYMHFKIQNTTAVVPLKKVEGKTEDSPQTANGGAINIATLQKLNPAQLMNQNENNKIAKRTDNN
ncbi:Sensory neuron membrane protein 1 [Pseudolycoriella hygida]|uniref:Sensory neuron membrane protein 1 n=1 Tax=Pseudolycoriella hygida TaxID=35572 RepID=A0A9Q0RVD8_9DIPT|nr:Sensory neuron membrane protein 1 [Pseudolycoriella hygida]